MPALEAFEAFVFKPGNLSMMPRASRAKLRLAAKKAHKKYRNLEIKCAIDAEISAKMRDALTNELYRRYVGGAF